MATWRRSSLTDCSGSLVACRGLGDEEELSSVAAAAGLAGARVSVAGEGEAAAAAPPSREAAEIDFPASGPGATAQAGRACSSRMSHPSLRRVARRSG